MGKETPIHQHDCSHCDFLGLYDYKGITYDLYYHKGKHPYDTTVIARYGVDGEYYSGLCFAEKGHQPLAEVLRRAIEQGLHDAS
jgi:hypothetical protein